MLIWVYFMLTCAIVSGFPVKKITTANPSLETTLRPKTVQQGRSNDKQTVDGKNSFCKRKSIASIAQKAAAEAKAAQAGQNTAAAQAAHIVKTHFADKALQAAKAAEAALAGKQAVVAQLQQEVKEAETVVAENTAAVSQQQGTVNAACLASQKAVAMHKILLKATRLASKMEKSMRCVLKKSRTGFQEKCNNLREARARLAHLQHKLQRSCEDCKVTKQAAQCACEAARAACGNART